jgi:hypothetical protein
VDRNPKRGGNITSLQKVNFDIMDFYLKVKYLIKYD